MMPYDADKNFVGGYRPRRTFEIPRFIHQVKKPRTLSVAPKPLPKIISKPVKPAPTLTTPLKSTQKAASALPLNTSKLSMDFYKKTPFKIGGLLVILGLIGCLIWGKSSKKNKRKTRKKYYQ